MLLVDVAVFMPLAPVPCAKAAQPGAVANALMRALNDDSENVRITGAVCSARNHPVRFDPISSIPIP